jgi:hypothetical protein
MTKKINPNDIDLDSVNSQVQYIEDLAVILSTKISNEFLQNIVDQIKRNIVLTSRQHQAVEHLIWQNAKLLQLNSDTPIVAKSRRIKITDCTYCAYIAHNFLTFCYAKSDVLDCLVHRFPHITIKKRYRDYYVGNISIDRSQILDLLVSYGYTLEQQTTFDNIFEMEK